MSQKNPPLNMFGAMLVARDVLMWTKANAEEDSTETFISKMNRPNWIMRVSLVMYAMNRYGPTTDAAKFIQKDGQGFFTDVSEEALAEKLEDSVSALKAGGVFKFREGEFGVLDFTKLPAVCDDDACGGCGGCDEEEEETEEDDPEEA